MAPDGWFRKPGPGRYTKETAPKDHNIEQYFFSPTLTYYEYHNLYARPKLYVNLKCSRRV